MRGPSKILLSWLPIFVDLAIRGTNVNLEIICPTFTPKEWNGNLGLFRSFGFHFQRKCLVICVSKSVFRWREILFLGRQDNQSHCPTILQIAECSSSWCNSSKITTREGEKRHYIIALSTRTLREKVQFNFFFLIRTCVIYVAYLLIKCLELLIYLYL